MKAVKISFIVLLSVALCVSVSLAENRKSVAEVMFGSYGLSWTPKVNYAQLVLTVSTPSGKVFKKVFDSGSTPGFDLSDLEPPILDGTYNYELKTIPQLPKANLRDNKKLQPGEKFKVGESFTQSGMFTVLNGGIINPFQSEGPSRTADQVVADDMIVQMSLCVGTDCVNGESFGFDTIRLKENNLRIRFYDTSNTASFPTNDWQLTANSSDNGGGSYFAIEDIDGGRTPFTIEASAPSHSLYVDNGGRIGFGTSTPVVELHVQDGDTPTLRLEQDGSSGFTAQTWDVAGNEANFFVRDVTNGSALPLKIVPGASSNLLYLSEDDRIGINTSSPSYPFHVKASSEDCAVVLERTDGASAPYKGYFSQGQNYFYAGSISALPLRFVTGGTYKMQLETSGNLTMAIGNGYYNASNGDWINGSSREFKENIEDLDAAAAIDAFKKLNPVTFKMKHAPRGAKQVGFIAEDVPDLVATENRKGISPMDIVAVLTKVVQEQQKTIDQLKQEIKEIKEIKKNK